MKILGLNHLGLAPKDPDAARRFFCEVLQLPLMGQQVVAHQSVSTTFIEPRSADLVPSESPVRCDTLLEILAADPPGTGPVARFVQERGGGIQHLALEVDSLDAWIAHLKSLGIQLVGAEPTQGAHGTRVIFVHPRATGGVLVELVEVTH